MPVLVLELLYAVEMSKVNHRTSALEIDGSYLMAINGQYQVDVSKKKKKNKTRGPSSTHSQHNINIGYKMNP